MTPRATKATLIRPSVSFGGFTLIELAVVLIIIAMVSGMGLVASRDAIETARRTQTKNKLAVIEDTLLRFRLQHNRLPCPGDPSDITSDATYGDELGGGTTACTSAVGSPPFLFSFTVSSVAYQIVEGSVPVRALGLPDEYMYDGWGRHFAYAVDPQLASTEAFSFIAPDAQNCSVTVTRGGTTAAAARTTGAAYVLLSYGPNGHGGYNNTGTKLSMGITNTDEQINCHCDATGAYVAPAQQMYVQNELVDTASSLTAFDDIVVFKERWQLQNGDDAKIAASYKEYQLAVSYDTNSPAVRFYKYNCQGWTAASTTATITPDANTVTTPKIAFTRDNNILFVYSDATNDCVPYTVGNMGGTVADVQTIAASSCYDAAPIGAGGPILNCVPAASCPAYNSTNILAMSNNDYLAIADTSNTAPSPYIKISRGSKTSTNSPYFAPIPNPFLYISGGATQAPPGPNKPTIIAFSKNAEYLFLSDKSSYGYMYMRTSPTTFRLVYNQPTGGLATPAPASATCGTLAGANGNCTDLGSATFSPDGKYFAVGYKKAGPLPAVKIWKIAAGTPFVINSATGFVDPFTLLTSPTYFTSPALGTGTDAPSIAFSPDSKYFAMAGGQDAAGAIANVKIFKIGENDVFTALTASSVNYAYQTTPLTGIGIAFSTDSKQLLVPVSTDFASPAYGIAQFKRVTSDQFNYVAGSETAAPFYSTSLSVNSMVFLH